MNHSLECWGGQCPPVTFLDNPVIVPGEWYRPLTNAAPEVPLPNDAEPSCGDFVAGVLRADRRIAYNLFALAISAGSVTMDEAAALAEAAGGILPTGREAEMIEEEYGLRCLSSDDDTNSMAMAVIIERHRVSGYSQMH